MAPRVLWLLLALLVAGGVLAPAPAVADGQSPGEDLQGTSAPVAAGSTPTAADLGTPENTSVDTVAVWEADDEIEYSIYGHTPAYPRAGEEPTGSDWQWWSLDGSGNGTIADGTAPDVAFSRRGVATAVWVSPDHTTLYAARFNGTAWSSPEVVASTTSENQLHDPALAFDGNGTGLLAWTLITDAGTRDATYTIRTSVRDESGWGNGQSLLTGVEREVAPAVAFTDSRDASRQNTGLVTWWGIADTETVTCDGDERGVDVYWPHGVTWNGTFSSVEELPGRPESAERGYSRAKFPRESKLGLSPDQKGNAALLWTPEFDTDPCDPDSADNIEEWTARWNGSTWDPDTVTVHGESGPTAGLAVRPDGGLRTVTGGDRHWPSVAALHRNHGRTVSVGMDDPGLSRPIEAVVYDQASGVAIEEEQIGTGRNPSIASRTGSPGTPLAEWSYLSYLAVDNDLHGSIVRGNDSDRAELQAVGSTSLVNAVSLIDPNSTHDPSPFPDPGVRYEYVTAGDSVELEHLENLNSSDPDTLERFLAYATEVYPADRYVLDLGSHGYGWKEHCPDYGADDEMHLPEFQGALANTTPTLDLLAFSQCLMGQLEVAHEIQGSAEFMIGSEEIMPGTGPNYTRRLRTMTEQPHQPNADLSAEFVASYEDQYEDDGTGYETLAATDLEQVSNVSAAVDALATAMLANFSANSGSITGSRARAQSFSESSYKDLGHYASLLNASVDDPAIRSEARNVDAAVDDAVVAEYHGENQTNATGLTTYLPVWNVDPRYNETRFGTETNWDAFLTNQTWGATSTVRGQHPEPGAGASGPAIQEGHAGPSRIQVTLEGSSRLAIRTSDSAGNTCGLGFSQTTGRCTLPLVDGACSADRVGDRAYLSHPSTTAVTWEIDGADLQTETAYALTVAVVENGTVVRDQKWNGTIAPGENATGTATTATVADYATNDGVVDTDGLRRAVDDWQAGLIDGELLLDVLDAWSSGRPV